MTRSLSAGVLAEIATNKLNPVELIYFMCKLFKLLFSYFLNDTV